MDKKPIEKVDQDALKTYISKNYIDTAKEKLSSFELLRMDTISDFRMYSIYYDRLTYYGLLLMPIYESTLGITNNSIEMAKLGYSLDKSIGEIYKSDAQESSDELKEIGGEIQLISSELDTLSNKMKTADTSNLIYYRAICATKVLNEDMSTRLDTFQVIVRKDFSIVPINVFYSEASNIYGLKSKIFSDPENISTFFK